MVALDQGRVYAVPCDIPGRCGFAKKLVFSNVSYLIFLQGLPGRGNTKWPLRSRAYHRLEESVSQ